MAAIENVRAESSAVASRRTFAIISHPDAGKTTLTEKLLFASGAIQQAGAGRGARATGGATRSDWMEIEQQRGISISSSVMTFEHRGLTFNLLDTPGHSDFSEDTYRTLTAVDAAVMVIDVAKGIESQTLKLFEVCRLRDIPIITFINKVDREGQDPLALLDEIADTAGARRDAGAVAAGRRASGSAACVDLRRRQVLILPTADRGDSLDEVELGDPLTADPVIRAGARSCSSSRSRRCRRSTSRPFAAGHLTPVIFGSALNGSASPSCSRDRRLGAAAAAAAGRSRRRSGRRSARSPASCSRSRPTWMPTTATAIAFVRLSSGTFTPRHEAAQRADRPATSPSPTRCSSLPASARLAEEAVAGRHHRHPQPRHAQRRRHADRGQRRQGHRHPQLCAGDHPPRAAGRRHASAKQLAKALSDLAEEGVAQVFRPNDRRRTGWSASSGRCSSRCWLAPPVRIRGRGELRGRAGSRSARWAVSSDPAELKRVPRGTPLVAVRGQLRRPGLPRPRHLEFQPAPEGLARHPLRDNEGTRVNLPSVCLNSTPTPVPSP